MTGQKSRWVLPEEPLPTGVRCYSLIVPDERQHIAAFKGALFELCKAYLWADDEAHTAVITANRWKQALETLTETCMAIQFRQPDICTLEASLDGGATWTQIYTAQVCVTNGVNTIIQGYLDDGTLAPGGQPGPGASPELAVCKTFTASMNTNGLWRLPISVQDGWTIRTFNITGAAQDGEFNTLWNCANGKRLFFAANCDDGFDTPAQEGDPLQTAQHMRLIARIGGVYVDMYDTTYVVPDGTGQTDVVFQANDGTLGDNSGNYQFAVEVCNYTTTYCHLYDFRIDDGNWVKIPNEAIYAETHWVGDVGWVGGNSGSNTYLGVQTTIALTGLAKITAVYINNSVDAFENQLLRVHHDNTIALLYLDGTAGLHTTVFDESTTPGIATWNIDYIQFVNDTAVSQVDNVVQSIQVEGEGQNPFTGNNC